MFSKLRGVYMASEGPVDFRSALSRKDAIKPPSPWQVGVVMFLAHLPNAGRMDYPLPDTQPGPDRSESPSPVPCARPDRIDSPSPPALTVSPSPPDRVKTPSPVLGTRLDPLVDTTVVPGASEPPAATPVPAVSPVAAGLRLPHPPPHYS
jgi:hypothetical protein